MSIDTTKYPKEQKSDVVEKKIVEDIVSSIKAAEDNRDNDGDGLTNKQEEYLGTNKDVFDTDGDGFADGHEVSQGTNPLIKDMIKKGDVDGLKAAIKSYNDPVNNIIALRALSRFDKSNRQEYQNQIDSLLTKNPSLAQPGNNKSSSISDKLTQQKNLSNPQHELTMTFKNTSET
jgi:hypothetical protein